MGDWCEVLVSGVNGRRVGIINLVYERKSRYIGEKFY